FRARSAAVKLLSVALLGAALLGSGAARAANLAAPPTLKLTRVPEPPNLADFVKDKKAAIALGKALFWDMQVGSDGVQSCATCHFHAGVDHRTKNEVNPGQAGGDDGFQLAGPNATLLPSHFPLHQLSNPADRLSPVVRDRNDVIGSQGVLKGDFVSVLRGTAKEVGTPLADPVFHVGPINTRRTTGRNAPSVINAAFNYNNFWDGRANFIFNGVNPFGDADANARIYVNDGSLQALRVHIPNGSLASQAVGPPGNAVEMSLSGRTFPDIGKKLLALRPLGRQLVEPSESVLGPLSRAARSPGRPGLVTTYADLIKAAFLERYWGSTSEIVTFTGPAATTAPRPASLGPADFTQMQANFSLFFGLAVQLYESTLISDDSPFDRFQEGDLTAMTVSAQQGLNVFLTPVDPGFAGGSCNNCHGGSEFTNATIGHVGSVPSLEDLIIPERLIEHMAMGDGGGAFYDSGYYNIGVRPTEEDKGRGGADPFGYPLSFTGRALLIQNGTPLPFANPPLFCGVGQLSTCTMPRVAVDGTFKTPTLRNVELTGPYFHNGGQATLRQVVDFYTRGGDFNERNIANLDSDIQTIDGMNEVAKRQLVDFLMALTDERVRWEKAPFDHPELFIPEGAAGDDQQLSCKKGSCDSLRRIPPVGSDGRAAAGLPPLGPFLDLDPHTP
ncbi:MAG TPA: cytochrome c peroxidase, partial [Anaeromyxobacteraceae bacterium]